MKWTLLSASVVVLMAGSALAQNTVLTAAETGGTHHKSNGISLPASTCWFNGTIDFRGGLTSERNTAVSDSWTFDDVDFPGGSVTGFRANFIPNLGTQFSACDIIVYSGLGEGTFGTLMGGVADVTNYTLTPTGNNAFGRDEFLLVADLGGSAFNLAAGTYHVGIRLVGVGSGQAFVVVTSGSGAIGTPPGNNGRTFLQSTFFGYPLPTDWQNLKGAGTWDVSYGLECASGFQISLAGTCPGRKTLSWTGAGSGQMGVVFGNRQGSFTIPSGRCQGTQLGIQENVTLFNIISTRGGSGEINTILGLSSCGMFVQCINAGTCATSNVAGPL